MIAKTEAIVLKSFDYRETSKIVIFFSKEYGKVKGVLKGIRKDHKKFGSNVDKFTVNDIVYYQYRNSEIHLVSQCDLKEYFYPIRQDMKRTMAASYLLELIDLLLPVEEANQRIYYLMKHFLDELQTTRDVDKLIRILQIKLLLFSGFRPHLDSCVVTNKKITGRAKFSMALGGLVNSDIKIYEGPIVTVSGGAVSTILFIERNKWKDCLKLGLTKSVQKELKFILNNFLVYHLGKKVKTEKYLG